MILDLLPDLSRLYFMQRLPGVSLPRLQAGIVMGLGLQRTTVDALAAHFDVAVTQVCGTAPLVGHHAVEHLPSSPLRSSSLQVLALFNKAVRKLSGAITGIHERAVEAELDGAAPAPASGKAARAPAAPADDDDEEEGEGGGGKSAPPRATVAAASALLAADPELRRYAVPDDPWAWAAALKPGGKVTAAEPPRVVSIRHSIGDRAAAAAEGAGGTPGSGHKRRTEQGGAGPGSAAAGAGVDAEVYDPRNRLGESGKLKQKKARA